MRKSQPWHKLSPLNKMLRTIKHNIFRSGSRADHKTLVERFARVSKNLRKRRAKCPDGFQRVYDQWKRKRRCKKRR